MSLIIEDGTGKADAESYVSVAEVLVYLGKLYPASTFITADIAVQERRCRQGTTYIDLKYGSIWIGDRANQHQALDWPRKFATDADNYAILTNEIPARLKLMAYESIQVFAEKVDVVAPQASIGTIKSESVTVGPLSKSVEYMGGKNPTTELEVFPKINRMARWLVDPAGNVERG